MAVRMENFRIPILIWSLFYPPPPLTRHLSSERIFIIPENSNTNKILVIDRLTDTVALECEFTESIEFIELESQRFLANFKISTTSFAESFWSTA